MTTTSWAINGVDLTTATVTVTVTPGADQSTTGNVFEVQPAEAFSEVAVLSHQRPRFNVVFRFVGVSPDRYNRLDYVRGILQNRTPFTLTRPTASEVRWFTNKDTVALLAVGDVEAFEVGLGHVTLEVPCIMLGVPAADGGSYESCAGYSVEFLENDFWAATNTAGYTDAPLLGVPEQASGFVKARSVSTAAMVSLTRKYSLIAAGDGVEGIVQVFDLAGYAYGAPHADGDGGPAYVCESEGQEETAWD